MVEKKLNVMSIIYKHNLMQVVETSILNVYVNSIKPNILSLSLLIALLIPDSVLLPD